MKRVVIIGGGFAGLYAARSLGRAGARVTIIDRRNHHVFQPLLYQVATASLSPADIAAPIRHIVGRRSNTDVLLAEAVSVDPHAREVVLRDGRVGYDYLIVACGVTHSYFGNDQWAPFAPGLKSIEDATEVRRRFLLAFEAAERETNAQSRRAKLTFVVVGGGPTGVELAGAMAEIAHRSLPADFRAIDTTTARIILVEGEARILTAFPETLSDRARHDLERLGVEVRLNARVTSVDANGVMIGADRIDAACVLWAAGVAAEPLGRSLGAECDRAGRVKVNADLSVPGRPEIFVAGDLALVVDRRTGQPVPGVAPAAMQMGRYAGNAVRGLLSGRGMPGKPFRYLDKGIVATIGRARAVACMRGLCFAGIPAWLLWAGIHIFFLIGFRNRLLVMIQWAWEWIVFQRGARLITGNSRVVLHDPGHDSRQS
ncbi:MAG: NAD(P)/FAD-dependent oxidoreductase [Phycisphaerales bacterium]|nr:NAD(P)/FAD-dependent oxidoreductase [Phycisphaerales bacterium]